MRKCIKCGIEINDGQTWCNNCFRIQKSKLDKEIEEYHKNHPEESSRYFFYVQEMYNEEAEENFWLSVMN